MSALIMAITATRERISAGSACAGGARRAWTSPLGTRFFRPAVFFSALIGFVQPACAEQWHFEPSLRIDETLTNNVNLEPHDVRRGDLVTGLTPSLRIVETGAHTSLSGFISLPALLYARTGSENDRVDPYVNLLGKWEMVDRLLFVEGSVYVTQQYLSPFGARPQDLTTATENRFTNQTYRISPYIKGDTSDYSYELRDNNIWTKGDANVVNGAYTNELIGTFQRDPRPLGWAVDIDRSVTKFQDQSEQSLALGRVRGLYQFDPQARMSVTAGYEHNDLLLESKSNPIYGLGVRWRPTELSNVDVSWEHRFFGASYDVAFENRTPLSVWNLRASRNVTTYPQQLATLPAGGDVAGILNQLFLSRVPDPAARQTLINQYIADRGLPQFLNGPVNLYTQQVTLQESFIATMGLLGARNSVFLTAYRLRQAPITGSGNTVPDPLAGLTDNTQYGTSVVWTHALTPVMTLTGAVDLLRTVDNTETGGSTRQGGIRAEITTRIAPYTDVYGGIRYQVLRSTLTTDYDELAVFVGVGHVFH